MHNIQKEQLELFRSRGYSEDLLPKTKEKRSWSAMNYFTLWQGSVHNVPNYMTIGGFIALGLSPFSIMAAVALSGFLIAVFLVLNGHSGSKYGVPFPMILRASYGIRGAVLPGFLRGCIAAIMWFGLQNFLGSIALYIIFAKIWPGFLALGGGEMFLGVTAPKWIAFLVFCGANIAIGFGGGNILKKFTGILNPCIYILFIGMTIWIISQVGFSKIMDFQPFQLDPVNGNTSSTFKFFFIINALIAVWAAPAVSAADFTQNAKSFGSQANGQFWGLGFAYVIFGFCGVCILAGASVLYGTDTWDILVILEKWDSTVLAILAGLVIMMATISTNATGNIIPATYQIISMFPKLSYRQGVLIASIASILICPWKLVENQDSIFLFLSIIGGMLGPVIGVMLSHYYVVMRTNIDLNTLYTEPGQYRYYTDGFNIRAFIVTIIAIIISLGGKVIPAMSFITEQAFFVGVAVAFIIYSGWSMLEKSKASAPESAKADVE